jgi:hypothetical protein
VWRTWSLLRIGGFSFYRLSLFRYLSIAISFFRPPLLLAPLLQQTLTGKIGMT